METDVESEDYKPRRRDQIRSSWQDENDVKLLLLYRIEKLEAEVERLEEDLTELAPRDTKKRLGRVENAFLYTMGAIVLAVLGAVLQILGLPKAHP